MRACVSASCVCVNVGVCLSFVMASRWIKKIIFKDLVIVWLGGGGGGGLRGFREGRGGGRVRGG